MFKYCRCGKVIKLVDKMCDDCRSKDNKRKEYYKNRTCNDAEYSKRHRFYISKEWKNIRLRVLSTYRSIDVYQYIYEHRVVIADTVHHINETKDCWEDRLKIDNLIPVSDSTHKMIHRRYNDCETSKIEMQRILMECLVKWNDEMSTPT